MPTLEEVKSKLKPKDNCKVCNGKGVVRSFDSVREDAIAKWDYCHCFKRRGMRLKEQGFDFGGIDVAINPAGTIRYKMPEVKAEIPGESSSAGNPNPLPDNESNISSRS